MLMVRLLAVAVLEMRIVVVVVVVVVVAVIDPVEKYLFRRHVAIKHTSNLPSLRRKLQAGLHDTSWANHDMLWD